MPPDGHASESSSVPPCKPLLAEVEEFKVQELKEEPKIYRSEARHIGPGKTCKMGHLEKPAGLRS